MQVDADDHGAPPRAYAEWGGEVPPICPEPPDSRVDVAIIGAGITGLSAACHLPAGSLTVAVLEAHEVGWGASGRAFGQIVPTLKHGIGGIIAHYGRERGERIVRDVSAGPDLVFGLIQRHDIDCGAIRTGLLFGAHSSKGLRSLEAYAADWQARGAPVDILRGPAAAAAVGSDLYDGACLDRRGGHLNPLGYVRGLARVAAEVGARVHVGARVRHVERRAGAWHLDVAGRTVIADSVIIATNAYTGELWPDLARSIVPIRVHGAVTATLRADLLDAVLPGGQPLTDTRRLYSGVRRVPGGRLHVTVEGPAFGAHRPPNLVAADRRIARLFGNAPEAGWEESWNGWIALTPEQFPKVHALGPGLFAGLGYSGRGLAAATMMGRDLARRVCGAADQDVTFPLTPVVPIRGRALAGLPIAALLTGYRLLDRIDEVGHRRMR